MSGEDFFSEKMSEAENGSLASLISSLSESFRTVPPTAIPPVLDCILASTGISPSTIFDPLFDHLVDLVEVYSAETRPFRLDFDFFFWRED